MPDVPTMVESGYPGFLVRHFPRAWYAPAGTPTEIIDKLVKVALDSAEG